MTPRFPEGSADEKMKLYIRRRAGVRMPPAISLAIAILSFALEAPVHDYH